MTNRPTIPYDNDGFCTSAGKNQNNEIHLRIYIIIPYGFLKSNPEL